MMSVDVKDISRIAAISVALIVQGTAMAASQQFCSQYAQSAVDQYSRAGYLGIPTQNTSMWSGNYQHHRDWCLRVPESTANAGAADRQKIINAYGAKNPFCDSYATQAITQYIQAKDLGMPGIAPPTWTENRQHHYDWCQRVPEGTANAGTEHRRQKIEQYRARMSPEAASAAQQNAMGKDAFCTGYAQRKVNQYKRAVALNIPNLNPVEGWHDNFQKHMNFCKTAPEELSNAIAQRHEDYIAKHGGGNPQLQPLYQPSSQQLRQPVPR